MADVETRSVTRDDLLLLASLWLENDPVRYNVKVRNLSSLGLMGEGGPCVARGTRLTVDLRDLGAVRGTVAWVQGDRFGVAFDDLLDTPVASHQ